MVGAAVLAAAACAGLPGMLPISGTFLDVAYDRRLVYSNNVSKEMSCSDWMWKVDEWADMGIEFVIFQAVHDNRWGAYYRSQLGWMRGWGGSCADVVEAVLSAADRRGMHVLLSSEWAYNDTDAIDNPAVVARRHEIMSELSAGRWVLHPSFRGWYFSSEAYLTSESQFTQAFEHYLNNMSGRARSLTPGCMIFTSPYGTRNAAATPAFVSQLKRLDVDVIAYQDEVGCVRDALPVEQSKAAFAALRQAHTSAGRSALWANVESFTWQSRPNNVTSPLVPAPFPRVRAQIAAVSAHVDRVVSFTMQGLYQTSGGEAPKWGPPSALREFSEYAASYLTASPEPPARAAAAADLGKWEHGAVGAPVVSAGLPAGVLTDGLTGPLDPSSVSWWRVQGGDLVATVHLGGKVSVRSLGARFLQVPPASFVDGSGLRPVARGFASYLPGNVSFELSEDGSSWREAAVAAADWWPQELLDIRTGLYFASGAFGAAEWVRLRAASAVPSWAAGGVWGVPAPSQGRAWLLCDEIAVNSLA